MDLPQTPHPYKVIRSLGEGGMGEVFLAFDSRLKRQVAIKRLKESLRESDDFQRRFQREAQLAAGLNHPIIVHIYDVVEWEQANWLVMEYVEGCSLRQVLLDRGSLGLEQNLDLALGLAAGLNHAHQKGIVHRDLKAENVLFDAKDRPKIADFGIAKDLFADSDDQALTKAGALIGTIYAMSPEQAMGQPACFASDLFSLGVLLYESVTGLSPFKGANRRETLHRIIHHKPEPVYLLCPAVPRSFSDVIEHLLQKKPELRPRHAHALLESLESIKGEFNGMNTYAGSVATLPPAENSAPEPSRFRFWLVARPVFLALVLVWALTRGFEREEPLLRIGIYKSETDNPDIQRLLTGVEQAIHDSLNGLEGLAPIDEDEVRGQSGDPSAIAHAIAADELIRTQIDCPDEQCTLIMERLSADAEQIWRMQLRFDKQDELMLARAVASQLEATYARSRNYPVQTAAMDSDDYAVYLDQMFAFRYENSPISEIADRLSELRDRSPDFLDVYLLEARVRRDLFLATREPDHLDHGIALTDQAKKLQPQNPRPYQIAFDLALKGGRLDRAEQELKEILRFGAERAETLKMRAKMAEEKKDHKEALRLLLLVTQRVPSSKNLYNLANLERRSGLFADAREHYSQLLGKDPHHPRARRNLAGLELISGDLNYAERLFRDLVDAKEGNISQNLINLSLAQLFLGKYEKAVASAQRACKLSPKQITYVLNYADVLGKVGRTEEAEAQYTRVLTLLQQESDKKAFLTEKAQALAQLGQSRDAVLTIQEALSLKPEDLHTTYAAALVYSLVGDTTSALLNSELAIKGGYELRWFDLPCFDDLRKSPGFEEVLASKKED